MVKVRQDAWSHEDDLLLAETVLRHIREGSTQLRAFDEVGDKLNRTSAACGFRWNAEIRNRYEQAVAIAKRQRKEKKRAEQRTQKPAAQVQLPSPAMSIQERQQAFPITMDEETARFEAEIAQETFIVGEHTNTESETNTIKQTDELDLSQVIRYLQTLEQGYQTSETSRQTIHHLEAESYNLRQENEQLKEECDGLKTQLQTMKEDYQVLIQIMDRARKMVIFEEKDGFGSPAFRMDKNGNLEQVAK
ncbi:RsfA family transcriptional regulator [Terribacillus saccharophilus]|uniref:RsfA family transcriptional regulator n=1 Tax=Terribacillus saccharophilus TaxID=361277 RepID=UPI003982A817